MPAKTDALKAAHEERVLVVGRGVVLTANVTACDKVIVEGQFQGNIKTGTFILAEGERQTKVLFVCLLLPAVVLCSSHTHTHTHV